MYTVQCYFFFQQENSHISTNNTDNTEEFKIIKLKRKTNTKTKQIQFLSNYISDKGLKIKRETGKIL